MKNVTLDDYIRFMDGGRVDTTVLRVFQYVVANADFNSQSFNGSYDDIAKGANVCYSSAVDAMKLLQSAGYVTRTDDGWALCGSAFEEPLDISPNSLTIWFRNYASA